MFPDGSAGSSQSNPADVAATDVIPSGALSPARSSIRTAEKILVAYFLYVALLSSVRSLPANRIVLAWLVAVLVSALVWTAPRHPQPWVSILRDWAPLALILVGYWELQGFASSRELHWEQTWVLWDRFLLRDLGLRSTIEVAGGVFPAFLETAYLLVYAIPPFCMGALYILGGGLNEHARTARFLTTLLLGGFSAYALLPFFPTVSPRLAFPASDLPALGSFSRILNVWILDRFDISTGVFPSGHVAVAFSSSFGLLRALPERRGLGYFMLVLSTVVYIATVYGRYHYAVDGLASAGIALLAWRASDWMEHI